MKTIRIVVGVEGGIVQGVSTDAAEIIEVIVLDYDTDGAAPSDGVKKVPQPDGKPVSAFICGPYDAFKDNPWVAAVFKKASR